MSLPAAEPPMVVSYLNAQTTDAMKARFDVRRCDVVWRPLQQVVPVTPAVVIHAEGAAARRALDLMLWGFVPGWAKDMDKTSLFARAETLEESGFFRASYRSRRCLVPATALHLRATRGSAAGGLLRCGTEDEAAIAVAGLWEAWGWEGDVLNTFCLITVPAQHEVARFQARMPLLLAQKDWGDWLSGRTAAASAILSAGQTQEAGRWPALVPVAA